MTHFKSGSTLVLSFLGVASVAALLAGTWLVTAS